MAKLHAIAFNDKMPPQVQLEAIKHALKVTGAFEAKQTIQVDVGTNERTFADFVGDAIIDVEEEDWDEAQLALPPSQADVDVVDADVVDDYDEQPIQNRHDRAAFAEVERAKPAPRRSRKQAEADAEEAAVFAEQERRESFNKANKRREAFLLALDAGATHEMATEAGRRAAEGITPEPFRRERRRARVSTAEIARD
ncbi:hypothetical protein ACFT30_13635 [Microbacterium ureisolvens]|uniref:hypothetical protein n=1 Tax=Microbacterium ureisolvens TaxID=2781186 RepID=UPI003624E667